MFVSHSFCVILEKKKLISGLPKPTKLPTSVRSHVVEENTGVSADLATASQKISLEDSNLTFSEKKQFWESIESPKEETSETTTESHAKVVVAEKRSNIPVPKSRVSQIPQPKISVLIAAQEETQILAKSIDIVETIQQNTQPEDTHAESKPAADESDEEEVGKRAQFFIGNRSEDIITKSSTERRTDYAFTNEGFSSTQDSNNHDEITETHQSITPIQQEKAQLPIEKSETEISEKLFEHDRRSFPILSDSHAETSFDSYEETKSTTTDHSIDQEPIVENHKPIVLHSPVEMKEPFGSVSETDFFSYSTGVPEPVHADVVHVLKSSNTKSQPDTLFLTPQTIDEF